MKYMRWNGGNYYDRKKYDQTDIIRWADRRITPLIICISGVIVLILPALFLVLLSDFPQKGGIDFLYQMRCSKKTWIWGQILFALEAVIFLVVFLIVSSCIMMSENGVWQMRFSNAVTYYSSTFPERTGDYILQLLPENLYQ